MLDKDFDAFFQANERRIHYQIHRLGVTGEWYGEFYSEGLVALWRAYREHDGQKGKLGTFLNARIRYRLIDLMRKKMREKRAGEVLAQEQAVQLLDGNQHRGTGMPLLETCGVELVDDSFWQAVREHLTEKQWTWVYYYIICDLTVKEIMELEDVTADAVKGWGRAVRRKLGSEELRDVLEGMV